MKTFFILFLTCFCGINHVSAVGIEQAARSYKILATQVNIGVDKEEIARDSSFSEIDDFLGRQPSEIYFLISKDILNGPPILTLKSPRRMGASLVIGFTEEINLKSIEGSQNLPLGGGRYVFYWDQKYLRADLFQKDDFNQLVRNNQLNISEVAPFSFPEMVNLSRTKVEQAPSSAGAPPMPGRKEDEDGIRGPGKLSHPSADDHHLVSQPSEPVSSGHFPVWALALLSLAVGMVGYIVFKNRRQKD